MKKRDGGIFLRFLIASIIIVAIAFVIKIDLQEGTLPLASFYEPTSECKNGEELTYVTVQVMEGDTMYSLFAATPSPTKMTYPDRLAKFYQLNPHLQLQSLVPGEQILMPMQTIAKKNCTN